MCVSVLLACVPVFAPHLYVVPGGQERVLDPRKLEFQVVLSYHVGTGNQAKVFWKRSQDSYISTAHSILFLKCPHLMHVCVLYCIEMLKVPHVVNKPQFISSCLSWYNLNCSQVWQLIIFVYTFLYMYLHASVRAAPCSGLAGPYQRMSTLFRYHNVRLMNHLWICFKSVPLASYQIFSLYI